MTLEAALDAGDLGPQRMVEALNVLPGLSREKEASFLCFQSLNIAVVFCCYKSVTWLINTWLYPLCLPYRRCWKKALLSPRVRKICLFLQT